MTLPAHTALGDETQCLASSRLDGRGLGTSGLLLTVLPFSRGMRRKPHRPSEGSPDSELRPFLRWAGGKQFILGRLLGHLPRDVRSRPYWEPFLGAGSMFFAVRPSVAFLADANPHLIHCYEHVKARPHLVADNVRRHARLNSVGHYYRTRDAYNRSRWSAAQAARFIYLNRTCFNGIFRVNMAGSFNVPYGYKRRQQFPTRRALVRVGHALRDAEIADLPFEVTLDAPDRGHFVYLDPPYPPISDTAYFEHYTMDRFGEDNQRLLSECWRTLSSRGVLLMMTNADTPKIRRLYRGYFIHSLDVTRFISCKSTKHRVKELVITNYEVS